MLDQLPPTKEQHSRLGWAIAEFQDFLGCRACVGEMGEHSALENLVWCGVFHDVEFHASLLKQIWRAGTSVEVSKTGLRKNIADTLWIYCWLSQDLILQFRKTQKMKNMWSQTKRLFHGKDWEDSHGKPKKPILQQVLLPHEIVGNFVEIGEVERMMVKEEPCQPFYQQCLLIPLKNQTIREFSPCMKALRISKSFGKWRSLRDGSKSTRSYLQPSWRVFRLNQGTRIHKDLIWMIKVFYLRIDQPRTLKQTFLDVYPSGSMETELKHSEAPKWNLKMLYSDVAHLISQSLDVILTMANTVWQNACSCHLGKQKFEILTIQFPACPSSSTLHNRVVRHCCKKRNIQICIKICSQNICIYVNNTYIYVNNTYIYVYNTYIYLYVYNTYIYIYICCT